ncbi:hypothetical protein G20c_70 [Thermus phage G20c]|nr:hypothetical protein G20c_70 [Thermus phage G20c]
MSELDRLPYLDLWPFDHEEEEYDPWFDYLLRTPPWELPIPEEDE